MILQNTILLFIRNYFILPRLLYHDTSKPIPEWIKGYNYYHDREVWIDALLWIFLVVPMALFTYWVWEPGRLRRYRLQFWSFLMQKMRGKTDGDVKIDMDVSDIVTADIVEADQRGSD